jgi:hypothetical protein
MRKYQQRDTFRAYRSFLRDQKARAHWRDLLQGTAPPAPRDGWFKRLWRYATTPRDDVRPFIG